MTNRINFKWGILFAVFALATNLSAQTYKIYFGDLHEHSLYSWDAKPGALPPEKAYAYAKHVAHLDFMAISDHTNGLSESHYQKVRAAADAYRNPDSQFVAIPGQELGSLGSRGYGHMNIFDPLTRADNSSDDDTRYNLSHAYQFLIDNNLPGQFNHPTTENGNNNFQGLDYYEPVDLNINTLEVLNGVRSSNYEFYYLLALEKGWHLGAVGDQDNHASRYGDNVSNTGDIYLTGLLADSLTKDSVLDAIRKHRTYAFQTSPASDRFYLDGFTANGHWMGEEFANTSNVVTFYIAAHAQGSFLSVQLYKNGLLLNAFEPGSNTFSWTTSDSASFGSAYYFVKIVQEDTDVMWSSPIWVNSPGEYQPPEKDITPIATFRENAQNGVPRRLGWTNVVLRGVATVGSQFGFSGPGYIQDGSGGVAVFGSAFTTKVIPGVPMEFEVRGAVGFFNGQTEIIPYSVSRVGVKSFPEPVLVTTGELAANGERYEGSLVIVSGARISGAFPPSGANANLSIDDGSGACILRIDKDTNIPGTATPQSKVNIVGVVSQYDTSPPYNSGYQLLPRSAADIQLATGVADPQAQTQPEKYMLEQNYPNPFNAGTVLSYSIPRSSHVKLEIYTLTGRVVATLVDQDLPAGQYRTHWSGTNDLGRSVASGIYLYKLEAGEFLQMRKMILLQ